ncbi:phage tail tube protein [Bradyrhizobium sp. SZCCHNRI2049]|uniref:phage tail tube protein n=1 Tax=Bradyrhizobium sp. SZCCHNRI2049 TaxID=3057287 RepID=UPI002916BE35|nr:phage tail tube protein [Bradyrhizobium sp. SZCCHNRI2049]
MADLQTTNRVALAKVRETTFGVTPANPAFKAIRQTSSGLNANPKTVITQEIRPDRQVTDLILVGQEAGGSVGGEVAFSVVDDDLEEALQGTWSNNPSITVLTSDTEISDLTTTTATVAAGGDAFKAGMLTQLTGFPTAANNKLARVASSTGTSIVYPAATFSADAVIPVGATIRQVGFEGASGDLVATTSGGNALTSTVLDFTTLNLAAGKWVKVGDGDNAGKSFAVTAANNGFCRVSGVAANRLSFDRVPAGWAGDTGTGVALRVFTGDFLTNASTKRSNTIERQYLDHSPVTYEYLTGMTLNTLQVEAKQQAIATYTKNYIGKSASTTNTRVSGATDVAAPTYAVLNTSTNVGRIGFDGAVITGPNFVMSATINVNNNLRAQMAVGSLGAVGTGNGEFTVTGTLETYFGDKTLYDKIINNTLTSFDMRIGRSDGYRETILFDFPSIKLGSGAPSVAGKNQDVTISAGFTAFRDATLLYTVGVGRFWYLPTS